MKKLIILIVSAIILFSAGTVLGSNISWQDQLSIDASNEINQAAKAKTDGLTDDIQANIGIMVKERVDPIIQTKIQELETEIQNYFDSKIDGIAESQAYTDAVADLDRIQSVLLANYKTKIDQAFAGQ